MKKIRLTDLLGHEVTLDQGLECSGIFQVGDIVEDLSCEFHPLQRYFTVVGFSRSVKGKVEFLWYTNPFIWTFYGEIRVYFVEYSLEESKLPWLKVRRRNWGSSSSKKEIFSSLLRILKMKDSLL